MLVVAALGYGIYLAYVSSALVNSRYLVAIGVGALAARLVCQWLGAYDEGMVFRPALCANRILGGLAITFGLLLTAAFALKISSDFSRVWLVSWFLSSTAGLMLGRLVVWAFIRQAIHEGRFGLRSIILGASPQGQCLAAYLRDLRDPSIRLLGFVDDRATRTTETDGSLEILGDTDELVQMIRRGEVDQVFLALPWTARERLRDIAIRLSELPVHIRLAPDLAGFEFSGTPPALVAGLPMLQLFDRPISGWSYVLKRAEDLLIAVFGLIFSGPFLAVIALAVKLDSPGPVFFRQTRRGFNRNLIEIWKFRTMYVDRSDADCEVQTRARDPRVTRMGRLLRRTSLDELPQLFNVLRGEMSIVGPRPHALATKAAGFPFEEVVNRYASRHRVKPGLTGWAQIHGWRGETDTVEKIRKRVECDLYYIENWSLWLDLWIILKTLPLLLGDQRAY